MAIRARERGFSALVLERGAHPIDKACGEGLMPAGRTDLVEVHWADGVEAYVTPVGPRAVNVAFLTERKGAFEDHLARFPRLQERLDGAAPASETLGSGPLAQGVRGRAGTRLALLGDA